MEFMPYVFIGIVGLVSGVLSGVSGGGAGMLMIPAFIFVGLPPQVAVATGKMNGLGSTFGGLSVFSKTGHIRKDIFKVMLPIAIVVGVITPFIFRVIDSNSFQLVLGLILLLLIPTLFIKKKDLHHATKRHRIMGYISYTGVLTVQALFGSGAGSLSMFVLTLLFGTTKLEANATKRAVTAILTPITFVSLLISGFIAVPYGIVGLVSVFTGTHIGSKLALRKGDQFISVVMAVTVAIAGISLLVSAARNGS